MSRRTQKNVGVIGLGIIGRRVADCLRHRRFSTFVWNRTPRAFPNFVGAPTEIAELCDFIQIFVSNDEALSDVIEQMKRSLGAHHVVMVHSTVSPATMRATAEIVQRRGAQLLDAPFTGSKLAAEKGELVYYIGGDEAAYRRARPVLEASSKDIVEIGEIGQATTIKVATNMITAAIVQSAAEALALVDGAGVPLEKFAAAMEGNGSNSGTLKMKLPMMMSGDFDPHFSVKHMLKDVEIATRLARSYGLTLPATDVARESLREQVEQGFGDKDYSAVAQMFFPDGAPKRTLDAAPEIEEQDELASWAERTPSVVRAQEEPAAVEEREEPKEEAVVERAVESVARNGHSEEELPEVKEAEVTETNRSESVVSSTEEEAVANVERGEEPAVEDDEAAVEETEEEPASAEAEMPEPVATTAEKTAERADEEPAVRRGFLSRLFGKSADY